MRRCRCHPCATLMINVLAAYLRVLGDSYRVNESPYDDHPKDWAGVQDIGPTERIFRFAAAARGDAAEARAELTRILAILDGQRHSGGIIHTGRLHIKVPKNTDPYWRCSRCGRVHSAQGCWPLHTVFRGIGCRSVGINRRHSRAKLFG